MRILLAIAFATLQHEPDAITPATNRRFPCLPVADSGAHESASAVGALPKQRAGSLTRLQLSRSGKPDRLPH